MKKHGMGFSKAMELVKRRRPQALPNFGFISQLQQFEKSIQGTMFSFRTVSSEFRESLSVFFWCGNLLNSFLIVP